MSLICVVGATGTQGGSVCRELARVSGWKVRGLCRNVDSESAKELRALGIEMVSVDVNDASTLLEAFKGATAIFSTSYFWHLFPTLGLHGAGEAELQQIINVANAAAKITTLKHLVLSVMPNCNKISGGQLPCPHWDYKALGGEYVKKELPQLAAKTTYLWVGWYLDNLVAEGLNATMRPQPFFDKYIFAWPSKPDAILPVAGIVEKNAGITVQAILARGAAAFEKYVPLVTNYLTMVEVTNGWSKASGKTAVYAEFADGEYAKVFGDVGKEVAAQLRFSEKFPDWHSLYPTETLSLSDLGIEDKVLGYYNGLEAVKGRL